MNRQKSLKQALEKKLGKKAAPRSFDILGNIAIIEIPKALQKKEKLIGKTLLHLHKNITTVVKKVGGHTGTLRLQKYKVIAGDKKKEALYKENKSVFKFHLEKTYFSSRLSHERLRIAELIKPGEVVLVMFSGISPYPIVFAKNSEAKKIVGVELNKEAHKYALENVKLNKINNVELYQGDARKVVPKLKEKFNRIVMPLPKDAESFLDIALKKIKKNGMIHLYQFVREEEIEEAKKEILKICKENKKGAVIKKVIVRGKQGPGIVRVCVDIEVK